MVPEGLGEIPCGFTRAGHLASSGKGSGNSNKVISEDPRVLISPQLRFGVGSEDRERLPHEHWGDRRSKPLGLSAETMSRIPNPCSSIPSVITLTDSPGKVSFGRVRHTTALE